MPDSLLLWVGRPTVFLPTRGQPQIGVEAIERSLWDPTGRTLRGRSPGRVGNPERVEASASTPSGFFRGYVFDSVGLCSTAEGSSLDLSSDRWAKCHRITNPSRTPDLIPENWYGCP